VLKGVAMGQATLDLPDPTLSGINAGPISPEALASADDLLSQLAGDDIDRLLAEADTERPPVAAAPPPGAAVVAPVDPTPVPADVVAEPTPEAAKTSEASTSDASTADAVTAAAIEAVLAPALEPAAKPIEEQTPPAEPAGPAEAAMAQPTFEPVDQKLLDEAAAQVASIMDVPAPTTEAIAAPSAVADSAEREALSEPLILPEEKGGLSRWLWPLVKILELINAPMNFFSDEVREAMGKIALVTTFNAAAVLVYVIVFRRGHH
jgi:hypothetical protein